MNVILRFVGQGEVYHERQLMDINPSSSNIGADEKPYMAILERLTTRRVPVRIASEGRPVVLSASFTE